ncbi:hypothetical protein [Bosea sp. PAMC 26642]|uniref:hypothetical protein n=1 Tax=Bosea sp. (strain PAMC 26642) TaxID=1792307 RepID=UPI00076FEB4D|nr:hypothetical protein [Bosea sp. PAMC 26642]AMJ58992.1 hypothetical protein AXW83_00590 [Bosea sp. PAMC 26642]
MADSEKFSASVCSQAPTELQRLWDEGIASGEPVRAEDAFARIKTKIDQAARNPARLTNSQVGKHLER